jgi:hypothetical protein
MSKKLKKKKGKVKKNLLYRVIIRIKIFSWKSGFKTIRTIIKKNVKKKKIKEVKKTYCLKL